MSDMLIWFGIGVFVGIFIGVIGYKAIEKDVDLDTDTAIAYLKDKGYYVNIKSFSEGSYAK